jgi:PAS domain S-box-containing protein
MTTTTVPPRVRPEPSAWWVYALAVVLPVAGSVINRQTGAFGQLPFATHFIAVVVVAAAGGMAPAMVCMAAAAVLRNVVPIGALDAGLPHYRPAQLLVFAVAAGVVSVARSSRMRSQQRLEGALAELQERTGELSASLGSNKCACWTFDLDSGMSPRWSAGSYPVFGRPFSEVEAMPSVLPLLHPEESERFPALIERLRHSHEPIVFEYRCPWPNGELHWLEMRATRIPGASCAWRGVTVDITERKQAEMALLRAEKLAAMGRLASTVAHEINNPLEAVTNLLYLARADEAMGETTRAYLAAAEQELGRLSNITRLTLGFVRTGGETAAVDVAAVAEEVLSIFQHRLAAQRVGVRRAFEPGVLVRIAPHELRQIITNLVANAADAVPQEDGFVALRVRSEAGYAQLWVEDNGEGIAADALGRIFEAFYSTKDEVGTGIGLWVSKELAEKNGGRIRVRSSRERGSLGDGVSTSFCVELPLAEAP